MAINLFGFSAESFEQFVQALSVHVIGPGVAIFGAGPDGGREATFDGAIPYPSGTDKWDGYGVIQAKCKRKTEGTSRDQEWALQQLEDELKKLATDKKRRRSPEYYIFVTNVVLTPAAGGGKDKADCLLRRYYKTLGLKDHAIWDRDQIGTFVDSYGELRKRFAAYMTPGDVLARIVESIDGQEPDFASIATMFLDRELRAEQDAKLDQAGHRTDERTPLAKVFIDLPTSLEATEDPPEEGVTDGELPPGFLREMVEVGSYALAPKSLAELARRGAPNDTTVRSPNNRFVVIGAPGSGKSTLAQFLAQIHRAALLKRREQHTLTPETRRIVEAICDYCEQEGIPWPATPRFPFRIDLSAFASALAVTDERQAGSLIEYLTYRLKGDRSLRVEDTSRWLGAHPFLLILDGLDEVPLSSNRGAVCNAIQDFLAEAAHVNADLLVIATTRPQGYNSEFGRETYEYRHLPPLSVARALVYARRFAEARYGIGVPKVSEMTKSLRDATRDELTARLMRTPLQLTFMATLVAAGGRPPHDRWRLFHEYYDTIYKRERQKCDESFQGVMDEHAKYIDRLHHDVGFILEVQGEQAGSTDPMMPLGQFEQLIEGYLAEDEWDDRERQGIKEQIVQAATTRLVFLTSRVAGKISFEVRSLQEYMAAERVMTGKENQMHERLRAIGSSSYWRNVFLFAAGKCFADPQLDHLRDTVKGVCDGLNDEGEHLTSASLAGSRLALDLLEDGTVTHAPKYARLFARLALRLLDLTPSFEARFARPGEVLHARLARVYESRLDEVYREELEKRLAQKDIEKTLGAWSLLMELSARSVPWSLDAADKYLPHSPADMLVAIKSIFHGTPACPWALARLEDLPSELGPADVRRYARGRAPVSVATDPVPDWVPAVCEPVHRRFNTEAPLTDPLIGPGRIWFTLQACFGRFERGTWDGVQSFRFFPSLSSSWLPYYAAALFLGDPTKDSLAAALRELGEKCPVAELRAEATRLPWPMASSLLEVAAPEDLERLARAAEDGRLGDYDDWEAAELRWKTRGVTFADLTYDLHPSLPFDDRISEIGFPFPTPVWSVERQTPNVESVKRLLEAFDHCQRPRVKAAIGELLCFVLAVGAENVPTTGLFQAIRPRQFQDVVERSSSECLGPESLFAIDWPEVLDPQWRDLLDWLGRSTRLRFDLEREASSTLCEQLDGAYTIDPQLHGLLALLGCFSVMGHVSRVPARLLSVQRFQEPRFQVAALLVRLAQPTLGPPEAKLLAATAARIEKAEARFIAPQLACLALRRHNRDDQAAESFVHTLRSALPHTAVQALAECDVLLHTLVSRRNSGLGTLARAQELGLPCVQ